MINPHFHIQNRRITCLSLSQAREIMEEIIGDDETLEPWEEWYAKTNPYGGSQEEYYRLKAIINNYNNFRNELRTKLDKRFKELEGEVGG